MLFEKKMQICIHSLQLHSNFPSHPFPADRCGPQELFSIPLDRLECVKPSRTSVQDRCIYRSSINSKNKFKGRSDTDANFTDKNSTGSRTIVQFQIFTWNSARKLSECFSIRTRSHVFDKRGAVLSCK